MFPYIEVFGRNLGMYPLMALCGILSSGFYSATMAKKYKHDYTEVIVFMLFISVGVIAGGHLLYALVTIANSINVILANLNKINSLPLLTFVFGGSVFYGGLIGGLITGWICNRKNKSYSNYIDIVATSIPLFHFFGRIGCFLGGCCFGIKSHFGFTFLHSPIEEANGLSRFPVQLTEAAFNLGLFFLLNYFLQNNKFKNRLVYVYLLIYPIGRFLLEFLRGDEYRGMWSFLSTSQIISILIFSFALFRIHLRNEEKQCGLI